MENSEEEDDNENQNIQLDYEEVEPVEQVEVEP